MCSGTFRPSRSHTHTHTRCLLSYLPAAAAPGPRVCVCVRNGDGGGAARGVGFWLTSQAMLSNQRRARGPGAGIGAARGQFSITRSPGASGEERSRAGGRRPPRRLGPGTGCRARGPSRLPRPPAALFPQPLRSRLLERVPAGAAQGPRRQEGRPTAPGLTGTQESGHREGRVTRSRSEPELRGPGLRAGGAREQRPPRRGGGAMCPSPVGSSGSQGIPPLGSGSPQRATPRAVPWRLCVPLPVLQCRHPREGRLALPHPGSCVGGPRSSLRCACVPLPSAPLPNPRRPLWAWGLGSWRLGPRYCWALASRRAPAAGSQMA